MALPSNQETNLANAERDLSSALCTQKRVKSEYLTAGKKQNNSEEYRRLNSELHTVDKAVTTATRAVSDAKRALGK